MSDFFFEQMRGLLGARYDDFKRAYDLKPRHKALRVNTLKIAPADFVALCDRYEAAGVREYGLRKNPLCENSFYTCVKPSLDPLYHAGLYYMQEPSAAAAVAAFAPFVGRRVIDLCAAPGGKATQAAALMTGGSIIANEVEPTRRHALIENIERLGVRNALVTGATADRFVKTCREYFDTVIVDAPCSGGGMMRYESVPYSADIVAGCAERQRGILDSAAELLCRDGYLLYSTCTFAREEDEDNVGYLISKGFVPVDVPLRAGEERGIGMPCARRIYPHNFDGEGHFYCILQKKYGGTADLPPEKSRPVGVKVGGASLACMRTRLDMLPMEYIFPGVPVYRFGVPVYEAEHRRVRDKRTGAYTYVSELSHALTHALGRDDVAAVGAVELCMADAERYIHGEQLPTSAPHGDLIATVDGHALGWARSADDGAGNTVLKNLYPRSLRI